ncbi:MAG TPA: hypothetical protein PLD46_04370 [Hyphomicrobium sp.]|nr:hypothetical protein [Hyphomicrobium sp.]
MDGLIALLKREIATWDSGWSIGSFGAIGEFHQDDGEELIVDDRDALMRATARGAIHITPADGMQAVAYELLSPRPHRWSQGLALCLPNEKALGHRRAVLTELGPDESAIRPQDFGDVLFDIGLAQPQIDFCVRTRNPELLAILRANCGKSTFSCDAGMAILASHPHRVVTSNLGRTEVYQKIGGPDTGGVSPHGPHTHVLPKLLAAGRTHSANTPIPDGLTPCAFLHPANPVIAPLGDDKAFDARQFAIFQQYLERYGLRAYNEIKAAVLCALDHGADPTIFDEPKTRLERVGLRNTLRQAARMADAEGDASRRAIVLQWRTQFDKADEPEDSEAA